MHISFTIANGLHKSTRLISRISRPYNTKAFKAHSPKPIQERTKNSVTEYAASSTIFTRASHACTAEVPGMYELTLIRMLAVCHNGVSRATTRVTIPRDQRVGSPFACPGRGLSSR